MKARLNQRERKAAQLLEHYETCERLARYFGMPEEKIDGKRISSQLFRNERDARNAATAQCNGEAYQGQPFRDEDQWEDFKKGIAERVAMIFGKSPRVEHAPPGFFVNGDPRGYALKIDNDKPEGKALIETVKLHTDWGGYGILSPEIDGN